MVFAGVEKPIEIPADSKYMRLPPLFYFLGALFYGDFDDR
jgi:hypothetical protein